MKKDHLKKLFLISILFICSTSCNLNVLSEFGNKSSDNAILYQARMYLGKGDWTDAITEFQKLSATEMTDPDVVADYASAYSGRCGLNFINLATQLQNIGAAHIMTILMQNVTATALTNYQDCVTAETILKTIANVKGVVSTEKGQYAMVFNSLAKIGAILNFQADANKDGIVDAGWNPCDAVNGNTYLPQAEVNEITTALALFYQNASQLSYASSVITPMKTICTAINGTAQDFCDQIDSSTVTAQQRPIVRGMVVETTDGIGLSILAGDAVSDACGN